MQGVWVQSLVRELRSHMLCSVVKLKKNKQKKTANGYIKGLVCSPENYRHHFQRICQGLT